MPKVKVSLFADPIDVPEGEIPVLRGQGLNPEVIPDEPDAPAAKAVAPNAAAKAASKEN